MILGGVGFVACGHLTAQTAEVASATAAADSVVVQWNTGPWQRGPGHRVRLSQEGGVKIRRGGSGERVEGRIDGEVARSLMRQAAELRLDTLPDRLLGAEGYCTGAFTDAPSVTIVLYRESGSERVNDDHGCLPDPGGPAEAVFERLRAFEDAMRSLSVDSLAGRYAVSVGRWDPPRSANEARRTRAYPTLRAHPSRSGGGCA